MKMQSTTNSSKGRKPTHTIYLVTGEGDNQNWTKIASAWPHQDSKGFGGQSALGRIVIRPVKQQAQAARGQQ